jgi:hypothetical protein
MVSLGELQAQVSASYAHLGMPSWPNPHPGMASPREDEYSRVTDPERYRIVHARARVWADRLGEVPGVEVQTLKPAPLDDSGHLGLFDRGIQLTSARPRTLALLLLERDARLSRLDASQAVLHISVVKPQIEIDRQPDCGCDACDSGSVDLLWAIDETIGNIVGGPFVALRGKAWQAWWYPANGTQALTRYSWSRGKRPGPDPARATELCLRLAAKEDVRLPKGTEAFVGGPWLD